MTKFTNWIKNRIIHESTKPFYGSSSWKHYEPNDLPESDLKDAVNFIIANTDR